MTTFDPVEFRKAVAEFTPRRPQKFQDIIPAKEVIVELRQRGASYRSIAAVIAAKLGGEGRNRLNYADGKAPTVQMWAPRSVQTVEQAAKECPCNFKEGQKVVVEFDLMEPNGFDAKNGVIIRASSLLPLE